ncbi:MAG TPA: class I SAM-dependent methyltransferase [Candidatus Thermoplasmatota archaeon]|jgi:SAM-dependent methyltransferase|nr:class I SAM-dependent methyltransferase [Candidatus Thermoplasmatota archaeon]
MAEAWDDAASYEAYVGRWSRRLAPRFVAWASLPKGARVLDVGCGTGALSEAVLRGGARSVLGVDRSPSYVAQATAMVGGRDARFEVGDAMKLAFPDASFDAAVSGLVLNFLPDPAAGAREMARAVEPGGVVALYVWDYAGEMQMMRRFWDAARALDAKAEELDEGVRFPICKPDALAKLLEAAGLRDVRTAPVDQPTVFRDFDDYWTPFTGGQAPAPGYARSLPPERLAALRERLRATLPTEPDGSIHLVARAWAARGTRA